LNRNEERDEKISSKFKHLLPIPMHQTTDLPQPHIGINRYKNITFNKI
jgi:hypothetical protein